MKSVRTILPLMTGLGFILALSGAAGAAESITGQWKDSENGAISQIYDCGGGICIKVVKASAQYPTDASNPDPKLKGRSMTGVTYMSGAVKDGDNRWKGKLYNAEDGSTYTGYVTLASKNEVKLEGCVLGGLVCKSRVWTRAQ